MARSSRLVVTYTYVEKSFHFSTTEQLLIRLRPSRPIFIVTSFYVTTMTKFQIKGIDSFNPVAANLTVRKVAKNTYRQYDSDYFFNCLLEYVASTDTPSINAYVKSKKGISKTSFIRYYHKSGLSEYKKHGAFDPEIGQTHPHEIF